MYLQWEGEIKQTDATKYVFFFRRNNNVRAKQMKVLRMGRRGSEAKNRTNKRSERRQKYEKQICTRNTLKYPRT